jgi:hypothetical protein
MPDALEHLHEILEIISPADLFAHWREGAVDNIGTA